MFSFSLHTTFNLIFEYHHYRGNQIKKVDKMLSRGKSCVRYSQHLLEPPHDLDDTSLNTTFGWGVRPYGRAPRGVGTCWLSHAGVTFVVKIYYDIPIGCDTSIRFIENKHHVQAWKSREISLLFSRYFARHRITWITLFEFPICIHLRITLAQ